MNSALNNLSNPPTTKRRTKRDQNFGQPRFTLTERLQQQLPENGQDRYHVQAAYELLKDDDGRLVSVMSEGPFFRANRKDEAFRSWLDEVGGGFQESPQDALFPRLHGCCRFRGYSFCL